MSKNQTQETSTTVDDTFAGLILLKHQASQIHLIYLYVRNDKKANLFFPINQDYIHLSKIMYISSDLRFFASVFVLQIYLMLIMTQKKSILLNLS